MDMVTEHTQSSIPASRKPRELERATRIPFGDERYFSVMDFLIQEARTLDTNQLESWQSILAPDIFYYMSQVRTLSREDQQRDTGTYWYYENRETLALRIGKFLTAKSAFAEDPPSRLRRYVSNVTLFATANPNEVIAESYLQLLRNRGDASTYETISCVREDILRRNGEGWLIAQRHIAVDQAVLGTHNLSFFL